MTQLVYIQWRHYRLHLPPLPRFNVIHGFVVAIAHKFMLRLDRHLKVSIKLN